MTERRTGRLPQVFSQTFARKLNGVMAESEAAPTGQRLAKALERSEGFVSERKNGKASWTIDDLDVIAEEIGTDGLSLMATVIGRMRDDEGGTSAVPSGPDPKGGPASDDLAEKRAHRKPSPPARTVRDTKKLVAKRSKEAAGAPEDEE